MYIFMCHNIAFVYLAFISLVNIKNKKNQTKFETFI